MCTVTLTPSCLDTSNPIFSAAYVPSFSPASATENCASDTSLRPGPDKPGTYSFVTPARSTFDAVMHELNGNMGCSAYRSVVTGLSPF